MRLGYDTYKVDKKPGPGRGRESAGERGQASLPLPQRRRKWLFAGRMRGYFRPLDSLGQRLPRRSMPVGLFRALEGEHGVGGGRVTHEMAGVG